MLLLLPFQRLSIIYALSFFLSRTARPIEFRRFSVFFIPRPLFLIFLNLYKLSPKSDKTVTKESNPAPYSAIPADSVFYFSGVFFPVFPRFPIITSLLQFHNNITILLQIPSKLIQKKAPRISPGGGRVQASNFKLACDQSSTSTTNRLVISFSLMSTV